MRNYSRIKVEQIVIGTLMNEFGDDGFLVKNMASLRKDLFNDRRHVFIFGIIEQMVRDGRRQTTPYDILCYCDEKGMQYGNIGNFSTYMCEISMNYAFKGLRAYVRELVQYYIRDRKNG